MKQAQKECRAKQEWVAKMTHKELYKKIKLD